MGESEGRSQDKEGNLISSEMEGNMLKPADSPSGSGRIEREDEDSPKFGIQRQTREDGEQGS